MKGKVNIEVYTGIHKNEVADLILQIQNAEFGIPISLAGQPDLDYSANASLPSMS